MKSANPGKLITCIVPKGKALELVGLLHVEKGINSANVHSGRGTGVAESISYGEWLEVEILCVTVSNEQADEIFEFIYDMTDIGVPGHGFMFQGTLTKATTFTLPEIPEEGQKESP